MTEDKIYYPKEIHERVENGMGCASHISEGWYELVRELDSNIAEICPEYIIDQVKEKFGRLRYYISGITEDIDEAKVKTIYNLIHEAEEKSGKICAICGNVGKLGNYNGVYATRCEKHNALWNG